MTTHILGDNAPRKSNFDPHLAEKLTRYYEEHPEELNDKSISQTSASDSGAGYILMPGTDTYALGVYALQEACVKENNQNQPKFKLPDGNIVYRPNTFKENCLARLKQFNTLTNSDGSPRTLDQRVEFLTYYQNSCCGLAYPSEERKSSKFKLILQSPELISLAEDFKHSFTFFDYSALTWTRELERKGAKYNQRLAPEEIDSHEGWLALFEDDRTALRDYRKMVGETLVLLNLLNPPFQKLMAFWLLDVPKVDQLLDVSISSLGNSSFANGNVKRHSYSRFLCRKP